MTPRQVSDSKRGHRPIPSRDGIRRWFASYSGGTVGASHPFPFSAYDRHLSWGPVYSPNRRITSLSHGCGEPSEVRTQRGFPAENSASKTLATRQACNSLMIGWLRGYRKSCRAHFPGDKIRGTDCILKGLLSCTGVLFTTTSPQESFPLGTLLDQGTLPNGPSAGRTVSESGTRRLCPSRSRGFIISGLWSLLGAGGRVAAVIVQRCCQPDSAARVQGKTVHKLVL